jgi:hypothetical protein
MEVYLVGTSLPDDVSPTVGSGMPTLRGPVSQSTLPSSTEVGLRLPIRRKTVTYYHRRLFEGNITISHLVDALAPIPLGRAWHAPCRAYHSENCAVAFFVVEINGHLFSHLPLGARWGRYMSRNRLGLKCETRRATIVCRASTQPYIRTVRPIFMPTLLAT